MVKHFTTNRCISGWEVICSDNGRPVCEPRRSLQSANGIAQKLNRLLASGDRKAFARALGSYE